jgi:hypothetical protein
MTDCKECKAGIEMCYTRPCMGTPEEFEKIIDAGFAEKLRVDFWSGRPKDTIVTPDTILAAPDELKEIFQQIYDYQQEFPNPHENDVLMLTGGTEYDKLYRACGYSARGKCNFLTEDELCSLHDLNLKPTQGRNACCKKEIAEEDQNLFYANLWATPEGERIVSKFLEIVMNK